MLRNFQIFCFLNQVAILRDNIEVGTRGSELQIYLNNGSGNLFTTNNANLTNGRWYHLGITYGNNLGDLFRDGNRTYKSGWSIANLTGNEDSGISSDYNYTCAVNVFGTDKVINGVTFKGKME